MVDGGRAVDIVRFWQYCSISSSTLFRSHSTQNYRRVFIEYCAIIEYSNTHPPAEVYYLGTYQDRHSGDSTSTRHRVPERRKGFHGPTLVE